MKVSFGERGREDPLLRLFLDEFGVDFIADKGTYWKPESIRYKIQKNQKSVCYLLENRYLKIYYPLLSLSLSLSLILL